jgi:hypothetical protein
MGLLQALTIFDWISPLFETVEEVVEVASNGGDTGWSFFYDSRETRTQAEAVLDAAGIHYWNAETIWSGDSWLTVKTEDKDRATLALSQAGL